MKEGIETDRNSDLRIAVVDHGVESAVVERDGESESREEDGMVAGDHETENGVTGGAVRHAAANNVLEVKRGGGERRYSRDGGTEKQQSKTIQ